MYLFHLLQRYITEKQTTSIQNIDIYELKYRRQKRVFLDDLMYVVFAMSCKSIQRKPPPIMLGFHLPW